MLRAWVERIFGDHGRSELQRLLDLERRKAALLLADKRDQMRRADRAEHDLSVAREDLRAVVAKVASLEHRVEVQVHMIDDIGHALNECEADRNALAAERDAALAEVNQLKASRAVILPFAPTYTPEVLL